jgi:copper chaperone CopZ
MYKTTLKIDGMMCGMCEAHVNDVIRKAVPDAAKIKSSHRKGECTFISGENADEEAISKALNEIGYKLISFWCEPYVKRGLFG